MSEFVNAVNNHRFRLGSSMSENDTDLPFDPLTFEGTAPKDFPFLLTINSGRSNMEIVKVIGLGSDLLTYEVERGQEGTTAQAHEAGSLVENNFTAGTYQTLVDAIKERVYIEDEKTINGIKYKKYSDGRIEIKGKVDLNIVVSTSIGDIYRSDNIELTMIDESDIKELYYCNFWPMKPTTFNYWVGTSSGSLGDFSFRVYAPTDRGNTDITIGVYAIGRWK